MCVEQIRRYAPSRNRHAQRIRARQCFQSGHDSAVITPLDLIGQKFYTVNRRHQLTSMHSIRVLSGLDLVTSVTMKKSLLDGVDPNNR